MKDIVVYKYDSLIHFKMKTISLFSKRFKGCKIIDRLLKKYSDYNECNVAKVNMKNNSIDSVFFKVYNQTVKANLNNFIN